MNLGTHEQDLLDLPTKSFEVAYRSFIVDTILKQYPVEQDLKNEIQNRITTIKNTGMIMSGKITGEMSKLISNTQWTSFWENLQFVKKCYLQQQHTENHDVMFLSQIVYLSYMFTDLFQDLIKQFTAPERYITESNQYYEIRNALSHRGSTRISSSDAKEAVSFMQTIGNYLPATYFWYKAWETITNDIQIFLSHVNNTNEEKYGLIHENLKVIPFPEEKIVCREQEIDKLFKFICAWDGNKAVRTWKHLTCICGYGGVGKTVLVCEFISRLLDCLETTEYGGLRPDFILFYSAKTERLDYNMYSGELQINKIDSQISTFEEWKESLLYDLSVEDFFDEWSKKGIIIIDNLETIEQSERDKIIQYVNSEVPQEIRVIITSRIPEQAESDLVIALRGFQKEDGQKFIREYISENHLSVTLTDSQLQSLINNSSGNTLVLVLALKRLNSKKSTFMSLLSEMQRLPKNDEDNSLSSFMYQCTVDEILRNNEDKARSINDILSYFSLCDAALNPEVIAAASKTMNVDEVCEILGMLSDYLIIERVDDAYILNEFAQKYVLIKLPMDKKTRELKRQEITTAVHQAEQDQEFLRASCERFPELKDIINEWAGMDAKDNITIAKAFAIYEDTKRITSQNCEYIIDQMKQEFVDLEKKNSTHPYAYYQRARILNELRFKEKIGKQYDEVIEQYYDRCFILLNQISFKKVKQTKTFPAIESLYSRFLLNIGKYEKASGYAENSISDFRRLGLYEGNLEYMNSIWVWGMSMIHLYSNNVMRIEYLQNARNAEKTLNNAKPYLMRIKLKKQINELSGALQKFSRISI